MINVHFNGEVVRCRDMKQIASRRKEQLDAEGRCKYGIKYGLCDAWMRITTTKPGKQTCNLNGCDKCPEYKKRINQGNTKKTFTIDWKKYRQLASAAHYLIKEKSTHKVLFLTLSFPEFYTRNEFNPHKFTKSFYYDELSNILFCRFAENLRKTYNSDGYIGVKEYGETTNRVHFHILFDLPYVDFRILNNIWVNTISDYCCYSTCAVRRDPGKPAIIRNAARAIRYVCKYISKCYGQSSDTRIVFISRNLLIKPYRITENGFNHLDYLKKYKSVYINTFEYVTVFKITERKEFNKFCHDFLYPLFECSFKWSEFHYEVGFPPG